MLYCETPVARAANRDRRTRGGDTVVGEERRERKTKRDKREGERREREARERCTRSPSNCALRAVAGNERGTTGGGVHSILFLPLLPFFVFSSRSIRYLGLFTLAAVFPPLSLSLAPSFPTLAELLRLIRPAYVI